MNRSGGSGSYQGAAKKGVKHPPCDQALNRYTASGARKDSNVQLQKSRSGPGEERGSVRRHQAEHPHQVWAMDLQFVATADGRRLKFLNVIDEHSRLCLAIRVGRRCKAKDVVAVLEELTSLYPAPAFIRSDNGPEFNCFAEAQRLRPCPQEMEREQWHPHGLHRARITVAERLCREFQQPLQGRIPQHRAICHGCRSSGLG
jgi:transposase InsO family protein